MVRWVLLGGGEAQLHGQHPLLQVDRDMAPEHARIAARAVQQQAARREARPASGAHLQVVSELLGELLVGQLVPDAWRGLLVKGRVEGQGGAGQPSTGGTKHTGASQRLRTRPPTAVPEVLLGFGCWHLGCSSMRGRAEHLVPTTACGGCGLARYCSDECARQHRALHRRQCCKWAAQLGRAAGQGAVPSAGLKGLQGAGV